MGAPLRVEELAEIRKRVEAKLPKASWLMICGSIQPGVPAHFYCEIIEMAKARGVKTLLDTDGDKRCSTRQSRPTVITPEPDEVVERRWDCALITHQCRKR